MISKDIDFRFERLKLNTKKRLADYGKIPESHLRNYFKNHYDPEQVTQALDELCEEGFCERFTTPRGASVIVVREEKHLASAFQEDVQARIQEAKA